MDEVQITALICVFVICVGTVVLKKIAKKNIVKDDN